MTDAIQLAQQVLKQLQPSERVDLAALWWDCLLTHWTEYERRADTLIQQIADYEARLIDRRDFPGVLATLEASLPALRAAVAVWHGLVAAKENGDFMQASEAIDAAGDLHLWRNTFMTLPAAPFINTAWWEQNARHYIAAYND